VFWRRCRGLVPGADIVAGVTIDLPHASIAKPVRIDPGMLRNAAGDECRGRAAIAVLVSEGVLL